MGDHDLRRGRVRRDGRREVFRLPGPGGSPAFVGKVVTASPAVGRYLLVNPVTVTGDETVGSLGAYSVDTSTTVPVYLVGTVAPSTGHNLICRFVDYRWVAEFKGNCRTTTYTAQTCGLGVPGALVTFTLGMTTLSGTTDAFGHVTVTFPTDGIWSYVIAPSGGSTGYANLTGTVTVACSTVHDNRTLGVQCTYPKVLTYKGSVTQAQSSFYFTNTYGASGPEPLYTLTYGPRPADIPKQLELLYFSAPGGVVAPWYVTMPDNAWFSPAVPAMVFGAATNVYFYLWFQGCNANVMVIDAPYGGSGTHGIDDTKGAGNNVISYGLTKCQPFQMKHNLLTSTPDISGTHGSDDITASPAGLYCCPRTHIAGGCTCP